MRSQIPMILLCAFALAGCRGVFDPSFMPAGYTYHQNEYNAPTGPKAPPIGYDLDLAYNDEMVALWRDAARDIVDAFESETGLTVQAVFVEKLPNTTAVNATFDHVLREELASRGYQFASFEGDNLHLRYEIYKPEDRKILPKPHYNDDADMGAKTSFKPSIPAAFEVALEGFKSARSLGLARRQYSLPSYGYVAGKGRYPARPLAQASLNNKQAAE